MAPVFVDPAHVKPFPDVDSFDTWLAVHHRTAPELWLKIYKKASGTPTISYADAVEVALCWGWIDGIGKSFDDLAYVQRFTPRRKKSIWSQVNRERVERLIAEGRMTEFGLVHVEAAKADGRWDAAYAGQATMEVPADLIAAIEADPAAYETFLTLNSLNRYALGFRLGNLKTATGRDKAIARFVDMLKRGETIYPNPTKPKT